MLLIWLPLYILSLLWVITDGVLDSTLDLFTTWTHDSQLQLIIARHRWSPRLQAYRYFLFSEGSDCDICAGFAFLPRGSVLMVISLHSAALSLRRLVRSSSLIRCQSV
jgi:hypothetical protein